METLKNNETGHSKLEEEQFHKDRSGRIVKSRWGLRRSIERYLIIGGLILTPLGFGKAIQSFSAHENQKRYDTIENIVNYESGKSSLHKKLLRENEINKRSNPVAANYGLIGVFGLAGLMLGFGYRGDRREFEYQGFNTS